MSRFIYSLEKDGYRCVYNYNVCGRWDYPYAINIYQKPSSGSGNPCRRYHEEFKEEMTYQECEIYFDKFLKRQKRKEKE